MNTFSGRDVWCVLVKGKFVTTDRRVVNVDVSKAIELAHKAITKLWDRMMSMEPKYKIEYLKH